MKKMLFALVMVASVVSQAALLGFEAGSKTLNGVNLSTSATVLDNGNPTALKMDILGAGLRTKTVLVAEVKVYVAQLFSDNKNAFSRDGANALSSLVQNSNFVALKIDMLRTVTASALATSFKEALDANGHAIDSELSNLLTAIEKGAPATAGKTITLLLKKDAAAGKTNMYYEDTTGAVQSFVGSAPMMSKIMSIWLGTPADDGLEKLKSQLLRPVY